MGSLKSGIQYDNEHVITDIWIQQNLDLQPNESSVYLMSFAKLNHGVPTVVTRFRQPTSVLNDEDGNIFFKSVVHLMKEAPAEATIQTIYDELRSFQAKIKRERKKRND